MYQRTPNMPLQNPKYVNILDTSKIICSTPKAPQNSVIDRSFLWRDANKYELLTYGEKQKWKYQFLLIIQVSDI